MLLFLSGFLAASLAWAGLAFFAWQAHRERLQAALNLPRASAHADIKRQIIHQKQMRRKDR